MLVHTIALELNQRGVMQGEGRSKEGQRLVLLTASQNKVNTHNKHDGQWTVVPTRYLHYYLIIKHIPNQMSLRTELEQTVRFSINDLFRQKHSDMIYLHTMQSNAAVRCDIMYYF